MNAKPLAIVMTTVREPNSTSGSIGWRTVCWVRRKPAAASAAIANAAITSGEAKPCEPASIAPKVNPLIASTPVACPGRSKGTTRGREGSARASSSNAIAPAGTLIKKISRQSARLRTPPSTGPEEEATAPPIAHTPADQRHRRGHHRRGSRALHEPGSDQHAEAGREPARDRRQDEHDHARREGAACADAVAQ